MNALLRAVSRPFMKDGWIIAARVASASAVRSFSIPRRNAPVTAAIDAVVALAEYFGIYGNAVVIDHGYGLLSLYGHLSRMEAKPGDVIKRGQTVGYSGATGLAGGDHLHFALLVGDVYVDPIEWWDAKWVVDHVEPNLNPQALTE